MYQQPNSQPSAAGQTKPVTCYNCGSGDHFMIACPEQARPIPAGLAAARAAQAAEATKSTGNTDNSHSGYVNRPLKRQKTGPIVTRFPAPPTGPVVTHYAPQPAQAPLYQTDIGHNYYTGTPAQPYQQQVVPRNQPYIHPVPPQQTAPYAHHGLQAAPSFSQGYPQPILAGSPQFYTQPVTNVPNMIQVYGPSNPQSMSQHGHQTSYGAPYQDGSPTTQIPQPYRYDSSPHYGQPHIGGPQLQIYPPLPPQPPFQGQPGQPYMPYPGPSPIQPYGPQTFAQDQNAIQSWGQPSAVPQSYASASHQPGSAQNRHRRRSYHTTTQSQSPSGSQGNFTKMSSLYSGSPMPQNGNGTFVHPQQYRKYHGPAPPFPAVDSDPALTMLPPHTPSLDKRNEEVDFDWELKTVFLTEIKKEPDPIGHPLPTVYDEQPILPPAYNAKGIISKYVRPNNLEIFMRDIRLSLHWPGVKADPAFNEIAFDSPLIPLNDITEWIQQRQTRLDLQDPAQYNIHLSPPPRKRTWSGTHENGTKKVRQDLLNEHVMSRNGYFPHGAMDGVNESQSSAREITPNLDRSTTPACVRSVTPSFEPEDDAWAPQPGEGKITTSPIPDSTEALLASLGVTGSPKPIAPNGLASHVSPVYMDEITHDFYTRAPARHDSGYASQRGSISHESKNITESTTPYSEYRQTYSATNPPPPPPPPAYMRKQVDGPLDSPSSDGSVNFRVGGGAHPYETQNNGLHQDGSPITPNSAEGFAHENMVTNERKVSKRADHLRQVDDVTPKLKRRQPKVADAYSRRW